MEHVTMFDSWWIWILVIIVVLPLLGIDLFSGLMGG
jgi:hypothetical protein